MSALSISLLGTVGLQHASRGTVRLTSEKGVLLLTRLAIPPGARHRRDALQEMLWPGAEIRSAQGRLRFVLHQLRGMLDGEVLADRDAVWLDASKVETDTKLFEKLAQEGTAESLAAACDLYRGDLLAGAGALTEECEDWLQPERERLANIAREAFWHLFGLRAWRGEIQKATETALRYLQIDPYCERMHAALMRLHLTQGGRASALRQHQQFRDRLARDLQVEAGAEIHRLRPLLGAGVRVRRTRFDAAWVLGREEDAALAAKPLVAVLPFRDISDGQPSSNLAAALTENVIADLSRFRQLSVLGWHTSFALLGHPNPDGRLRQLSVRYAVEGHIQRTASRIRVTAGLIDRVAKRQVWSERYEGDPEELPIFQERVARALVSAIPVQVEDAELARVRHTEMISLTAYELYLLGRGYQRSSSSDSHAKAYACFSRAIERDETLAPAYASLALSSWLGGGPSVVPHRECLERSIPFARRAIELDPLNPQANWVLGVLLQDRRDFELAWLHLDRAMDLGPGDAETLAYTGLECAFAGAPVEGVRRVEIATKLNPCYPPGFAEKAGKTSFAARRYDDALFWLRQSPDRVSTNRAWLAAAAAYAKRPEEAAMHSRALRSMLRRTYGEESIRQAGGAVGWARERTRFRNPADLEHYTHGLLLAGLDG